MLCLYWSVQLLSWYVPGTEVQVSNQGDHKTVLTWNFSLPSMYQYVLCTGMYLDLRGYTNMYQNVLVCTQFNDSCYRILWSQGHIARAYAIALGIAQGITICYNPGHIDIQICSWYRQEYTSMYLDCTSTYLVVPH